MNEVIEELLNFAFDHKIGYSLASLSPYTPSASNAKSRMIIINTNWHNKKELPFQVAHEIGHVLNDEEDGILYFTTDVAHSKIEHDANSKAVDLLLPIYYKNCSIDCINFRNFMSDLEIPSRMESEVKQKIKEYFHLMEDWQ